MIWQAVDGDCRVRIVSVHRRSKPEQLFCTWQCESVYLFLFSMSIIASRNCIQIVATGIHYRIKIEILLHAKKKGKVENVKLYLLHIALFRFWKSIHCLHCDYISTFCRLCGIIRTCFRLHRAR